MKKILKLIILLALVCSGRQLWAQNQVTFGIVREPSDPLLFSAVFYPNFSSTNITISTALFSFYLPAGTTTMPAVPVLPSFGAFYDSTGTWRIEKLTPALYAGFGFNPNDLQGNDVYQCILQNAPSPPSLINGQPKKLFSFRLPGNCMNGSVQMHTNNNSIQMALFSHLGININNQMSISVNDAPSADLYVGNHAGATTYSCPLIINVPPIAVNDTVSTLQGTPVTITVLANDHPGPGGSPLNPSSVMIVSNPSNGSVIVNANGTIKYTPNLPFLGTDHFDYKVCDQSVPPLCDTATVFIKVISPCIDNTPTVNQPPDQVVCNGGATAAVNFTGTGQNTTYSWSNTTPSIGLAASGTGNIASFTALNGGAAPVVATITVTPVYTSPAGIQCAGTAKSFKITVNPTPNVGGVASQSVCAQTQTTAVTFTSTAAGTVFSWTNNNVSIGLAASGTGNIAAFTAVNNGTTTQIATVTVTPSYTNAGVSCTGAAATFTISVFPRASVNAGPDLDICQNQSAVLTALLGGSATGGTWTSTGTGIFANPLSATTSYTPSVADYGQTITLTFTTNDPAGPCPATSDALLLTIHTLPIVDAGAPAFICPDQTLALSTLNASILPNGSGVTTGTWTTSGTGTFSPGNSFPTATTYTPSASDIANGNIVLTLTSADPAGPCGPVSDQVVLTIHQIVPLVCNDLVYISLDVDCVTEVLPDDVLEGTYQLNFYTLLLYTQNNVPLPGGNVVTAANVGQTLKAKVFDICSGNYCWGNVKIEDKLAPAIACTDVVLTCANTNYDPDYLKNSLGIATAYPTASDCSVFSLTHSDTWHDLTCGQGFNGHPDLSAYAVRIWTATDIWNNSSTCTQYLYFQRKHISDVVFPADVTVSCGTNVPTDPAATGAPYIVNFGLNTPIYPNNTFCELQAAYSDQVLPVCDGTHKILRTWTVVDWCLPTTPYPPTQNPLYYIQLIKVIDNQGPVMVCPANLTVSTDPFNCCATTDLPDIVISDNCSRINSIGAKVITYDPYTGDQTGIYSVGGLLTSFPGNNLWNPDTLAAYGTTPCLPQGTHTVTYTATDDCENTSTCSFRLTVRDYIPPVAACDQTTTVAIGVDDPFDCYTPADGCSGAGVTWVKAKTFDDGSYDNCNHLHFTVRRMLPYSDCINGLNDCEKPVATAEADSIKFYCCEVGTTQTVILRVYQVDDDGVFLNGPDGTPIYNECMIQVEVQDKIKPVCLPPANVTVSCENFDPSLWAYGKPSVADNCCLDTTKIYLGQCGLTHSANYNAFDTVCNRGTIVRTFRVFDCHGLSNQCMQRVIVNYNQNYWIHFPDDKIITVCDGTGNYGEPSFYGKDCELLGVSFEDQVFTVVPDACFKIERTWTIINWCTYNPNLPCITVPNPSPNATVNHPSNLPGPIVSPCGTTLLGWVPTSVKINSTDATATNYCTFWDANANCYKYKQIIKVIDTKAPVATCPASPVTFCDLTQNDATLWNESYWWDNVIGSHDLCEGPTDLNITGTDLCSGSNIDIRYLLFLDLDGDGIMETVISSTNLPGWNNVNFNNVNNPNFAGGTPRSFDERLVPANQKYGFAIQTLVNGKNKTANVRWNTQQSPGTFTIPELPYGTHKIKWILSDGCGNDAVCEYTFVVKDCKAPTVVCLNGLSVNIMPTGMIQMWASDFLQYGSDNCTPANQLKYGIRRSGTGTGFPVDGNGNPITNVVFTCADLGTQSVELWAIDKAGNADFCETYVIVQDNAGICPSQNAAKVAGVLATEAIAGVENSNVEIAGSSNVVPSFNFVTASDSTGLYHFNGIPLASNSTVTPTKDDDPLNGVTTYDLVLISKHILGIQPLGSPYKMIAADANKSGSITTFDIVELRKLILGIYTTLPNNTSWRFVDKAYTFPNPNNPFTSAFPENKDIVSLTSNLNGQDFVSVKIGDVNETAIANATQHAQDRAAGSLLFDVDEQQVKAGEEITVHFRASEKVLGYQFTINLSGLEALDVMPGEGMKAENFGAFGDAITTSFDGPVQGEFSVKFRATKSGKLSEMLGVSSRITKAEAYSAANDQLDVAFRFNQGGVSTISGVGFELYQNQPNPFVNKTYIGFHLPEAATATLTIYDETGRMVFAQKGAYAKGYNSIILDAPFVEKMAQNSVLYYKLETASDHATKKMIQMK